MVISLTGCCRLSEKAAITKIEKHLNEAYGGVFKVTMIEYDSEENTSTYLSYESYIRVHLKPALGNVALQDLTPRMLQLYYNYKAEEEGLAPKTIVNLNLFLHRALDFAVAEGYIKSNPTASVNLPRGDRPQIVILTRDEQMRLIQGSYQHRYGVFIRLVLFTGIRLGELLGLRWEDVDVQGRRMYIRRTLNRLNKVKKPSNPNEPTTEIVIQAPKSQNSVRSIPLLPQVLQDLQGWRKVQMADRMAAGDSYNDSGFLVTNTLGGYVEPRTYQSDQNFKTSGTHKVVMNGTAVQHVYLQSNAAVFTVLEIANGAGISSSGYFAAASLVSPLETAKIQSEGMMLRGLTVDAPYVEITGDVTKVAGTLSLGTNKLRIDGNLTQSDGTVDTKRGTLEVTGDYRLATKNVSEYGEISWDASNGILKMTEADAVVTVGGMFYTKSVETHKPYLTAGTMYIGGDFYQYYPGAYQSELNFKTSGSHTVYLNGTKPQNVYFQSGSSKFTVLHPTQSMKQYTFSPAACWTTLHGTTTSQVIPPDCDTPGCTLYTCTLCGGTYEEDPVDALGHDYLNGSCSVCGEADPDYVAPVTITGKGFSLSFEDEILVNFYYTVSDLTDVAEQGMLVFYTDPGAADIAMADDVYIGSATDGAVFMNTTDGIAAKYMGDNRYYCAYAKLANGSYAYSKLYQYSPKKYAMNLLGKDSTSEKQKALCVAMLNYGAAAQNFFGYKTDALMNSDLTDEQKALAAAYDETLFTGAVAADSSKVGSFAKTATGFSKRSASVSFEGALSINYYFTPDRAVDGDITFYYWTSEDYAAADIMTMENATGSFAMEIKSNGDYWGQVSRIPAKNLDDTYYVAGVYTDADGNTYCTGVIAYSLSKYCLNNAKEGKTMQELASATAMYGYYAKAYFS